MNKKRRKQLEKIAAQLDVLEEQINSLRDEEQEAFDSLPENLQYSERGDTMNEAINEMDNIAMELADLSQRLQSL